MDLLTMYLLVKLPAIGGFLGIAGVFLFVASVIAIIFKSSDDWGEGDREVTRSLVKRYVWKITSISLILIFIAALIPSTKQMVYLVGGTALTNVENVEKLPKNLVNAANRFLEDYTEDKKD